MKNFDYGGYGINDSIDWSKVNKVLIYQGKNLGDVLLSTPVSRVLCRLNPNVSIIWVVKPASRAILSASPNVMAVIDEPKSIFSAFFLGVKHRKIDLFIDLHGSKGSTAMFLGATPKYSTGVPTLKPKFFRMHSHTLSKKPVVGRHKIEENLDCLRRLGCTVSASEKRPLVARGSEIVSRQDRPYIIVHPGSRWLFKTTPMSFWVDLICKLRERTGFEIKVTGSNEDFEGGFSSEIAVASKAVNLVGKTSLQQQISLIAGASLFVGVDSFCAHLASTFEISGAVIFGPTDEKVWGPLQEVSNLIVIKSEQHTCRPCGLDGCGRGKVSDCLTVIDAAKVAGQLLETQNSVGKRGA